MHFTWILMHSDILTILLVVLILFCCCFCWLFCVGLTDAACSHSSWHSLCSPQTRQLPWIRRRCAGRRVATVTSSSAPCSGLMMRCRVLPPGPSTAGCGPGMTDDPVSDLCKDLPWHAMAASSLPHRSLFQPAYMWHCEATVDSCHESRHCGLNNT